MSEIIRKLSVIIAVVALSACQPSTKESTQRFEMPKELADCKIFTMSDSIGSMVRVVRCPAMETITTCHKRGKSTMCNSVVTGD